MSVEFHGCNWIEQKAVETEGSFKEIKGSKGRQ